MKEGESHSLEADISQCKGRSGLVPSQRLHVSLPVTSLPPTTPRFLIYQLLRVIKDDISSLLRTALHAW